MTVKQYEKLQEEVEKLHYHLKLLLMMFPHDINYTFFQCAIDFNFSETETAKILKTLGKISDKLNNRNIPEIIYTVGNEPIPFDTSVPLEQFGAQFTDYIQVLFPDKEISPKFLLKACKQQQLYPEVCDLLLEQLERVQ